MLSINPDLVYAPQTPTAKSRLDQDIEDEEEEEEKKREKEYFCQRGFGLGYRDPVAREHFKIA